MIGVNLSGAEYSWETYPESTDLDYIKSKGITLVRLPVAWEKLQSSLYGELNAPELAKLQSFLADAAARGIQTIIDLHNYARYNSEWATSGNIGPGKGDAIGTAAVPISAFKDFWTKLADELKDNPAIVAYDIMNEPNTMPSPDIWPAAAQAAVDGIRSVDMETMIMVQGDHWSGAGSWLKWNSKLIISDPANNLVYQAHQYFDDNSGNYNGSYDELGAYPNVGVDRLQPFLTWLKENNLKGFIGEFGVPDDDPRWLVVLENFIKEMNEEGLSGTYWKYSYKTEITPHWWPPPEGLSLTRHDDGADRPQLAVLSKHATTFNDPLFGDGVVIVGTAQDDTVALNSSPAGQPVPTNHGDVVITKGGADVVSAGKGNDLISTGGGKDVLNGGDGNDRLAGGPGRDVFNFAVDFGKDVIRNFKPGKDTIVFDEDLYNKFSAVKADMDKYKGGTIIVVDEDNSLFIRKVKIEKLDADDFLFN